MREYSIDAAQKLSNGLWFPAKVSRQGASFEDIVFRPLSSPEAIALPKTLKNLAVSVVLNDCTLVPLDFAGKPVPSVAELWRKADTMAAEEKATAERQRLFGAAILPAVGIVILAPILWWFFLSRSPKRKK
jgi:hypothetical protein